MLCFLFVLQGNWKLENSISFEKNVPEEGSGAQPLLISVHGFLLIESFMNYWINLSTRTWYASWNDSAEVPISVQVAGPCTNYKSNYKPEALDSLWLLGTTFTEKTLGLLRRENARAEHVFFNPPWPKSYIILLKRAKTCAVCCCRETKHSNLVASISSFRPWMVCKCQALSLAQTSIWHRNANWNLPIDWIGWNGMKWETVTSSVSKLRFQRSQKSYVTRGTCKGKAK